MRDELSATASPERNGSTRTVSPTQKLAEVRIFSGQGRSVAMLHCLQAFDTAKARYKLSCNANLRE